MKTIIYNIIIVVFSSFGLITDIGSSSTDEFANEKVECEAYCQDYDDDTRVADCSHTASQIPHVICDAEETYVDDIPFDTSKVIEKIDSDETDGEVENKQEEELTIFRLFIKWVSLLIEVE